ncbi:hypothetical protein PENSPDRAFT_159069 [Peniophora sp. CONT]|nr:hypothetical protein PENSPDRAFT_159069 [Peniophora sp. CONT]
MSDEDRIGADRRRLEISMKMPKPRPHMSDPELEEWSDKYIEDFTDELKSSQQWCCLFCDKPARTTATVSIPNLDTVPVMFYWVHALCNAGRGPCARRYIGYSYKMRRSLGGPFVYHARKTVNALKHSLFGGCAACTDGQTSEEGMIVCTKCNVARYYSEEHRLAAKHDHARYCEVIKGTQWSWK